MQRVDIIENLTKISNFKPDNMDKVKLFINTYIEKLININNLEIKDHIIYISGPVTGVEDYIERFNSMEADTYKAFSAQNVYVINPINILSLINDFSYKDKMFVCYALLDISDILVYDNSDNKYENSVGVLAELSFALGRNLDIYDYQYIKKINDMAAFIISYDIINKEDNKNGRTNSTASEDSKEQ